MEIIYFSNIADLCMKSICPFICPILLPKERQRESLKGGWGQLFAQGWGVHFSQMLNIDFPW